MAFYAYILRCADGSYYTGHTEDLDNRIGEHHSGHCGGYTRMRLPVHLVWSQDFDSRYEALSAERQIKGWSRAKKQALIDGDWKRLSLLARNRQGTERRDVRGSTGSPRTELGGATIEPTRSP